MLDKVGKVLLHQVRRCSADAGLPALAGVAARGSFDVFRSEFSNGMKVAAAKTEGARLTSCSIMFQAGSRVEVDDELGATHFIRAATTTTGCAYTGYMKSRHVYEMGGSLKCNSDRQTICFTLTCPPSNFEHLKYYLLDTAYRCLFFEWELDDKVRPIVKDDLTRIPPDEHALDLVQKALFGGGLSNSSYCVKERIHTINQEVLRGFTYRNFRTSLCSIGSVGIRFEDTLKLAESLSCAVFDESKPYCVPRSHIRSGVETYDHGPGADTSVAIAVSGAGTCDTRNVLKHAILAAASGAGSIFCGSHIYNRIPQPPLGLNCVEHLTRMKTFNISYCETGVFGILISTTSECANQRTIQATNYLAKIKDLTEEHFFVGKKRLMMDIGRHDQSSARAAEGMALMVATGAKMDTVTELCCLISCIPNSELKETAASISCKVADGELAIGIVGDVEAVPDLGMIFG